MQDTRNISVSELVLECTDEILSEPDYTKQLDIVERIQNNSASKHSISSRLRFYTLYFCMGLSFR